LAFVLDGEIDERGGAAESRGDRAGLEIVGAGGAPKGMSRWVWTSMPPGITKLPVASMTRPAFSVEAGQRWR